MNFELDDEIQILKKRIIDKEIECQLSWKATPAMTLELGTKWMSQRESFTFDMRHQSVHPIEAKVVFMRKCPLLVKKFPPGWTVSWDKSSSVRALLAIHILWVVSRLKQRNPSKYFRVTACNLNHPRRFDDFNALGQSGAEKACPEMDNRIWSPRMCLSIRFG